MASASSGPVPSGRCRPAECPGSGGRRGSRLCLLRDRRPWSKGPAPGRGGTSVLVLPGSQPRAAASFSDTETHQHSNLFGRWHSDDTFTTRLIQSTWKWLPRGEVQLCLLAACSQPSLHSSLQLMQLHRLLNEGISTAESFSPPLILIWISSLSLVTPLLHECWCQHSRTGGFTVLGWETGDGTGPDFLALPELKPVKK